MCALDRQPLQRNPLFISQLDFLQRPLFNSAAIDWLITAIAA
jgi:hypothetical protein